MTVLATLNLSDGTWDIQENLEGDTVTYNVGFTSDVTPTNIYGLTAHVSATRDGETLVDAHHPEAGITYEATDQEWVFYEAIQARFDDTITVNLTVNKDGVEYANEHTFTIPRPDSPFPSWVWDADADAWLPPTPYPGDDTHFYNWDEETTSWVLDPNA